MTTVGVVGLGAMRVRFAGRLLSLGHQVFGTNRTKTKAGALIARGLTKARASLLLELPDQAPFDVALMQKDLRLTLDSSYALKVPIPSSAVADGLLTAARARGDEHRDIAVLFQALSDATAAPAHEQGEVLAS